MNTTVLCPLSSTRCSVCQRTAPARATRSASRPMAAKPAACSGKEQAAGYCRDQPPDVLSQTFAASNCWNWVMYTALCTYGACSLSCSGEVIG